MIVFQSLIAGAGEVIRAYYALSKAAQNAGLDMPDRITSTSLRKYMATITQVRIRDKLLIGDLAQVVERSSTLDVHVPTIRMA